MSEEKMDPLVRAAEEISKMENLAAEIAKQSPDVKEGKCTVEDEMEEPSMKLFDGITKSVVTVFRDPGISTTLKTMSAYIPEDAVALLMNLLAVCMIQCTHRAITVYDDLLKEEITKALNNITEQTNRNTADIKAYASIIKVFKQNIGDIQSKLMLDHIEKTGEVPKE